MTYGVLLFEKVAKNTGGRRKMLKFQRFWVFIAAKVSMCCHWIRGKMIHPGYNYTYLEKWKVKT